MINNNEEVVMAYFKVRPQNFQDKPRKIIYFMVYTVSSFNYIVLKNRMIHELETKLYWLNLMNEIEGNHKKPVNAAAL